MLHHYLEAMIRHFYPAACEVCRATLKLEEKILCRPCTETLETRAWPMESALVGERFEYLDHVWTAYAYESPVRELLHGVKYARKDYLLKAFGERAVQLAQAVASDTGYDAILPIPLDRMKLIQRHFNQAEIFAEILKPRLTPPVKKKFLLKRHAIPSQTSLSREERAVNVYGAFKLRRPAQAFGKFFLLLDDVLTTGSTLDACAAALLDAGACSVRALTAARG